MVLRMFKIPRHMFAPWLRGICGAGGRRSFPHSSDCVALNHLSIHFIFCWNSGIFGKVHNKFLGKNIWYLLFEFLQSFDLCRWSSASEQLHIFFLSHRSNLRQRKVPLCVHGKLPSWHGGVGPCNAQGHWSPDKWRFCITQNCYGEWSKLEASLDTLRGKFIPLFSNDMRN